MEPRTTTEVPDHEIDKKDATEMETAEPALTSGHESTPQNEKAQPQTKSEEVTNENDEYITGIKLLLVVSVVSLAMFTMLLDTSIIVTVR